MKKISQFADLFDDFKGFWSDDKNQEKRDPDLEEEMDLYDLDEEEKELVRSGKWEPWEFETDKDDLEEDDYYYEDDL